MGHVEIPKIHVKLPAFDLGYSWFDAHVAPWFGIAGMRSLSMPLNQILTF